MVVYTLVIVLLSIYQACTQNTTVSELSTSTTFTITDTWYRGDFPNPQFEFQKCGRGSPSFICDPNRILTVKQGLYLSNTDKR